MTHRPAVVAFDVIETLMSLEPLRGRLAEIGQPPHLLEAWYTRTLRDGMALSATGVFVPFTDVAEAALRGLTGYTVSDEQVAQVMAGFSELPAFPDALPAMTTLTEAGLRVACVTNGSAYLTSSFLNRSGLGSLVDRVISVGEVYRWKPSAMVYLYAAEVLDVPPQWLALVAAHDWDCHGAKRAGLITGWVSRKSGGFGAPFEPPDVVGEDLTEEQARAAGLRVRTGTTQVPYSARGWIHKTGNDGFIKVIADADRNVLVGATSAGPCGGEVLSALQVAVRAEVPVATLRNMAYAYPTFHRAIEDALAKLSRVSGIGSS